MAQGGRITIDIKFVKEMENKLLAKIHHVSRGTREATEEACRQIEELTLEQVPKDTHTLEDAFGYEIIKVGQYGFGANLGYGVVKDPVNPRTGKKASEYVIEVHEDLAKYHPNGKAKFLEDPIREYQSQFGPGAAARAIAWALRNG